ncbi:MAG: Rdx family protein [Candidatus Latescibacteria bacterium]|nr:Rdx family protein [Candidatus Latescibacterota bacterium]
MTDRLLREFKQDIEGFTLIPSGGGKFEVSVDGELAFSKIKEGRFPDYEEIQPHVAKRV